MGTNPAEMAPVEMSSMGSVCVCIAFTVVCITIALPLLAMGGQQVITLLERYDEWQFTKRHNNP